MNDNVVKTTGDIKRAGKALIKDKEDLDALDVLSYFRSDHAIPLDNAYKLINNFIDNDSTVLLAKRLKRTPSIINKLIRLKDFNTQLSTMQDIGGCRVVFKTIRNVNKFVRSLVKDGTFKVKHNYIENPKDCGYRSIHLVGKFDNGYGKERNIELQVRTYIQHSWATAVEIVDLFTKESIKSNTGSKDWTEFFSLVSKQFVVLENNPYLHSNNQKLFREHFKKEFNNEKSKNLNLASFGVFALTRKLNIYQKFKSFRDSVEIMAEALQKKSTGYFLIVVEFSEKEVKITKSLFNDNELNKATEKYLEDEIISLSNDNYICALVSTLSINGLEEAYPNYFADSTKFIEHLELFNTNFQQNSSIHQSISNILIDELHKKQKTISKEVLTAPIINEGLLQKLTNLPENERHINDNSHLNKILNK